MSSRFSRRRCLQSLAGFGALALTGLSGCGESTPSSSRGEWLATFGRHGISPGRFTKPRGITIDADDNLYIVDMTARIQVFDADFKYLRHWQTPTHELGRPTGLSVARDGSIMIADTHYYRVLVYSPEGELLRTIGGTRGPGEGEFHFVTDIAEDSEGNHIVSEYGEWDRLHVYDLDWKFVRMWGGHGSQPGEFLRPQSITLDKQDRIWVADACNHRIQVFDTTGKHLKMWGEQGTALGQLAYPYALYFDPDGNLEICEYGNNRVQKFTPEGKTLGAWGEPGHRERQLFNPWCSVRDSTGRTIILDSLNHRVQVVRL